MTLAGTIPTVQRVLLIASLAIWLCSPAAAQNSKGSFDRVSFEAYLLKSAVEKPILDVFLDPKQYSWAQYDPIVGYRVKYYMPRDGIDMSSTISTAQPNGARTAHAYTDQPCRINTYGNSFTLCHQVSDTETWQEYLAGHLGEPIRNFGMGGFGVYQSYRRMIREEQTDDSAEYVMLYIWGDDHTRSLLRCRHAAIYPWWDHDGGKMFHNNFWANVEMDLQTGQIKEHENRLPTRQSLYKMTDPKFMYDSLHDDLALNLFTYAMGRVSDLPMDRVRRLAQVLNFDQSQLGDTQPPKQVIQDLLYEYGFAATKYILAKAKEFTDKHNKKLLVILFDPSKVMTPLVDGVPRYDQQIVDYLNNNGFLHFDMNLVHVADYQKNFKGSFGDYRKRYFIGHYNPSGNHFFAYSIKNTVVEWLNPKPITYQNQNDRFITFDGYLPR